MEDCLGRPVGVGDYVLMYSEYRGRQMAVEIVKYNPDTGKMSVIELEEDARQFSTNYWNRKLYKLESGYYIGNDQFAN